MVEDETFDAKYWWVAKTRARKVWEKCSTHFLCFNDYSTTCGQQFVVGSIFDHCFHHVCHYCMRFLLQTRSVWIVQYNSFPQSYNLDHCVILNIDRITQDPQSILTMDLFKARSKKALLQVPSSLLHERNRCELCVVIQVAIHSPQPEDPFGSPSQKASILRIKIIEISTGRSVQASLRNFLICL